MERIRDGRRDITIHSSWEQSDIPLTEFPEDARIGSQESFIPANMEEPMLYTGDVIAGVTDGEITFCELIYDTTEKGVMVDKLNSSRIILIRDAQFSRRFYQADEVHVYEEVVRELSDREGVEFDESKIQRSRSQRPR
jgi:hypothetical protein